MLRTITFKGVTIEVPDGYDVVINEDEVIRMRQGKQDYWNLMQQQVLTFGSNYYSGLDYSALFQANIG